MNNYNVLKPFHLSARKQAKVGDTVKLDARAAKIELAKGRIEPKGRAAEAVAATGDVPASESKSRKAKG